MDKKPATYEDWNKFLLKEFFYNSSAGDVIRLDVTPAWFEDKQLLQKDLIETVCKQAHETARTIQYRRQLNPFFDMLKAAVKGPVPNYLPLLTFFCLPFGEGDIDEEDLDRSYFEKLKALVNQATENETYKNYVCVFCDDSNYRFRDTIPDLFRKLKDWTEYKKDIIQGAFCYAKLHANQYNKVSYFLSQILMRPKDTLFFWNLFCKANLRGTKNKDDLISFLREKNFFPRTIQNLLTSPDDENNLLKEEVKNLIHSAYNDWKDSNYPEIVEERNGAGIKYIRHEYPQLLLGLSMNGPSIQRHIYINNQQLPLINNETIKIKGFQFNMKQYIGLTELIASEESVNSLWEELASGALSSSPNKRAMIGNEFCFYQAKCFVMTLGESYLIQSANQEILPEFFVLFKTETDTAEQIRRLSPNADEFECGNGWKVRRIVGFNTQNHLPDGYNQVTRMSLIKFVDGISINTYFQTKYLEDFLPDIEAFLPIAEDEWAYEIESPDTKDEIKLVPLEAAADAGTADFNNRFCLHRFRLGEIPPTVHRLTIRFLFEGAGDNDIKEKILYINRDGGYVENHYKMNRFGELDKLEDGDCYWPTADSIPDNDGLNGGKNTDLNADADLEDFSWEFYTALRSLLTGNKNFIRADIFYKLIYQYFIKDKNYHSPYDYNPEILLLSYLSVIDIYTEKHGIWSKFVAVPPTIYPLPKKGEYILTGCYSKEMLQTLKKQIQEEPECSIKIKKQYVGPQGTECQLLPPFVKLTGSPIKLSSLVKRISDDFRWCDTIPAYGYSKEAASVNDWFDCIWQMGNGCPRNVAYGENEWYDPLTYKFKQMTNPLASDPSSAITQHIGCFKIPNEYVKRQKKQYYYCITKAENVNSFVYVFDRSWARWYCNSNIQHEGKTCKFTIPYEKETGTFWLPENLKIPKVLARAVVACTGKIPQKVDSDLFCYKPFGHQLKQYNGKCLAYSGVPESIMKTVAEKLNAAYADTVQKGERIKDIPVSSSLPEIVETDGGLPVPEPDGTELLQDLAEKIVIFVRENREDATLADLIKDIPPVNELRESLIYTEIWNEDPWSIQKCADYFAKSIISRIARSWQDFYNENKTPSQDDIDQKENEMKAMVDYFLLSHYNKFLKRFYKNEAATLLDFCLFWGEVFIPEEKAMYFYNFADRFLAKDHPFKKLFIAIHGEWLSFFDDHDLNSKCEIKNVASKIVQSPNIQKYEFPKIQEIFWLFLYHLLSNDDDYKKNDLELIRLTKKSLQTYLKTRKDEL